MKLYEKSGYLNIPAIEREADANGISFLIIIGARQVGKTYGTLQHMLKEKRKFILMRRTQSEMDFICSGAVNPFYGMGMGDDIKIGRDSKYTGEIVVNEEKVGALMALSTVAKIRGFSGAMYTDLVFDEFIPELHVQKIRNEGDAFLNAVVTISGNRELDGKPPLRVWLLANSNNLASPILFTLSLTEKIESMIARGQEYSIMTERGIMLILPDSAEVIKKRSKTALFRAIGKESEFTEMALDNRFSYNDPEGITHVPIGQYVPEASILDYVTIFRHKSKQELYITKFRKGAKYSFANTERGWKELLKNFPSLKAYYILNACTFDSVSTKERFKAILGI